MSIDITGVLRSDVGDSGTVQITYGGFEIAVTAASDFPWERVLLLLYGLQHDVWVDKRSDHLVIMSKPPVM